MQREHAVQPQTSPAPALPDQKNTRHPQAIPAMVKGRELLCVAPTGSGKTAAFLIPTIAKLRAPSKGSDPKAPRALVVLPTRELAQQTYREAQKLTAGRKFRTAVLTKAGASGGVRERRLDLLITTPLRLVALMNSEGVELDRVETLVFDEADWDGSGAIDFEEFFGITTKQSCSSSYS